MKVKEVKEGMIVLIKSYNFKTMKLRDREATVVKIDNEQKPTRLIVKFEDSKILSLPLNHFIKKNT